MVGDRTPVFCVFHAVDDRAIAARRLAEAATVIAGSKRAEFAVNERNQFLREVIRIGAHRR